MTVRLLEPRVGQYMSKQRIKAFLAKIGLKYPLSKAWRFVRQPRTLAYEFSLRADYRDFQRQYGSFLHLGRELADPARKLLVLSFSDYVAQVKAEGLLAKALQLHGCTPVIVTNSDSRSALKYYRLFGIDQFVFFDKLSYAKPSRQALDEAEAFLDQALTVQDIKNYEYRGTRLGAHILRTITRTTYKGSIDLSHPDTVRYLKSLMVQGIHNVEKAEVLLDSLQPEVIFTHHPRNLGEGDIYEVALRRGINTVYWDGAQKNDFWIFKRYTNETKDFQPFSVSDESWERARQMAWTDAHEAELNQEIMSRYEPNSDADNRRLQEGKRLKTKEEVQGQLGLDPTKKTAVIFAHVSWDASFLHGEELFDTYEEWLVETTRAACANPAVNWIIKLHPADLRKLMANRAGTMSSDVLAIRNTLGTLPEHVKLLRSDTDINTFSLFELADYCLTVRGTIGIEMACFGIPVVTAGSGRYSGRGFTVDSATREEYLNRLRRLQDLPPMTEQQTKLAKKHAYCLFVQRQVKLDVIHKTWRDYLTQNKGHPLASNHTFQISSIGDLASDPSMKHFTDWAINGVEGDLLQDFNVK